MRTQVIAMAAALISFAATLSVTEPAEAQFAQCGERDMIVSQLSSKHKEQQAAIGLAKDGRLLEIWSNGKSRSFTIVLTTPTMKSCILAVGEEFEVRKVGEFIARFEF